MAQSWLPTLFGGSLWAAGDKPGGGGTKKAAAGKKAQAADQQTADPASR